MKAPRIDPRQLDMFAVFEDVFGSNFALQPSPGAAAAEYQPQREKIYMMHGPELELLTPDEVDRFQKGGFLKLAASMLMGAIDDVVHAITDDAKTAALAYFTEAEAPLPFQTVLDWLGPPLDEFTPEQWAARVAADPSSAADGIRKYWRVVEEQAAQQAAGFKEGERTAEGPETEEFEEFEPVREVYRAPVERPRGM